MNRMILSAAIASTMAGAAFAQTTTAPAPRSTPAPAAAAPSTTAPGTTAQSTTAPSTTSPSTTAPSTMAPKPGATASSPATDMSTGMKMATSATMAVRFVTVQPADFMSSRLIGATVYNNQNETVGEIEDLVIENGKSVRGVVVGVGGFLGMGESYVVLDPATVVLNQRDGSWRAYVDTSKDNLKSAPKFTYSRMKRS